MSFLNEAFKALNTLNEDIFSLSDDGIKKLSDFEQNDDLTDEISVIDPEAETEDDLQDSYVGKVILDCSVCHSKLYKDKTEITVDEEQRLVNVGEECPYCHTSDGFKVIGEVAPFKDKETEPEEEVKEDEPVDEKPAEDDRKDDDEDLDESLIESVNNVNVETDDSVVNVETDDNGRVAVTTEPKTEGELGDGDEIIAPISPETASEIMNNDAEIPLEDEFIDDEIDMDIDEFDEESFDELGESYLKNIYENVNSYKTTKVTEADNKIKIEGLITFNSGNEKKTSFVFESKDITTTGNARFVGENLNITRGKKAFTVKGKITEGKFISESLNYNYKAKDDSGKSTRIYGTVRRKG